MYIALKFDFQFVNANHSPITTSMISHVENCVYSWIDIFTETYIVNLDDIQGKLVSFTQLKSGLSELGKALVCIWHIEVVPEKNPWEPHFKAHPHWTLKGAFKVCSLCEIMIYKEHLCKKPLGRNDVDNAGFGVVALWQTQESLSCIL